MDSRGYGRRGDRSARASLAVGTLLIVGLCGICVGVYALLDSTTPRWLSTPVLVGGLSVGAAGLVLSGRGVIRSRYRPDRWRSASCSPSAPVWPPRSPSASPTRSCCTRR
jgi:energy-coupling factor transport system permease protein